jgi:phytoene dehydrogenase-like protein
MTQPEHDVIIIGGGHNGLVAASYLAQDGISVLVLERIERVGGAIGTEELYPGFHVPYCAYICHMLHGKIIEDLELRRHGFDLYRVDPWSFHPFPDGTHLLGWDSPQRFYQELRKFSEHDAQAYLAEWLPFWDRACGIIYRYFLVDPPTFAQVAQDLRGSADEAVWERMLTVSVRDLLDEHFEDDRVKAFFVNAQDAGDPGAPGSVLSVAYIRSGALGKPENRGIPKGGMGRVSEAMAKAARARGVEIRLGVTVEKVLVEHGQATGVRLAGGEELRASVVVSNADPKRTYLSLVDPGDLDEGFLRRVRHLKTRANCVKALVALREFPDFSRYLGPGFDPRHAAYVKICPSVDWFQASWDMAKKRTLPDADHTSSSLRLRPDTGPARHARDVELVALLPGPAQGRALGHRQEEGAGRAARRDPVAVRPQLPRVRPRRHRGDAARHREPHRDDGRQHPPP